VDEMLNFIEIDDFDAEEIGFFPGSWEEKINLGLQPYYKALEVLISSKQPK